MANVAPYHTTSEECFPDQGRSSRAGTIASRYEPRTRVSSGWRLLILACSSGKRPEPGKLPAVERYTGVAYKVLLGVDHRHWPDVVILSAEYGLIDGDTPIENYDRRFTRDTAHAMASEVGKALDRRLDVVDYAQILVHAGKDYWLALSASNELKRQKDKVRADPRGIGYKLGTLKKWLNEQ